jgi:hypothetical protein
MRSTRFTDDGELAEREGARAPRPPMRLRLRVRRRHRRLDDDLARGVAATLSAELTLRARQITDRRSRHHLASSLRRLVAEAQNPWGALVSPVPLCRRAILEWSGGLLGLADRLVAPEPVTASAAARVLVLLTDVTGPVYNPAPRRSLEEMIWWVADGLQLCPPHRWGCPVVMKIDPEHVAWTCARCGAIALTQDPSVKPA